MEVPAYLLKEKNRILKKYGVITVAEALTELELLLEESSAQEKDSEVLK